MSQATVVVSKEALYTMQDSIHSIEDILDYYDGLTLSEREKPSEKFTQIEYDLTQGRYELVTTEVYVATATHDLWFGTPYFLDYLWRVVYFQMLGLPLELVT